MIQFNLLPSVKVDYIKTKRLKRLIMGLSVVSVVFSVVLLMVMFSLKTVQNGHINNLEGDIKRLTSDLENTPDLNKMLSVQNQLNSLPTLYAGRPAVYRLPSFLDQTTPTNVGITDILIDFSLSTVEVGGKADTLESVNRYVDTLKFTKFKSGAEGEEAAAFSSVVLTSFGRDEKEATFKVSFTFTPAIFDDAQDIQLIIPSIVTTRSQVEASNDLFNGTTAEEEEGN